MKYENEATSYAVESSFTATNGRVVRSTFSELNMSTRLDHVEEGV